MAHVNYNAMCRVHTLEEFWEKQMETEYSRAQICLWRTELLICGDLLYCDIRKGAFMQGIC